MCQRDTAQRTMQHCSRGPGAGAAGRKAHPVTGGEGSGATGAGRTTPGTMQRGQGPRQHLLGAHSSRAGRAAVCHIAPSAGALPAGHVHPGQPRLRLYSSTASRSTLQATNRSTCSRSSGTRPGSEASLACLVHTHNAVSQTPTPLLPASVASHPPWLAPAAPPSLSSCSSLLAPPAFHPRTSLPRPSSRTPKRASCASTPTTSTGTTACCPRPGRTPHTRTPSWTASR
jgi:hypothetical protein